MTRRSDIADGLTRRRLVGTGAASAATFWVAPSVRTLRITASPGSSAPSSTTTTPPSLVHTLAGSVGGTFDIIAGNGDCGIHHIFDLVGNVTPFGDTAIVLNLCENPPAVAGGSFSLTAPSGSLDGAVGPSVVSVQGQMLHVLLSVTVSAGTDDFVGATGTVVLDTTFPFSGPGTTSIVSGTIAVPG